jgi:hypothetical protein
MPGYRAVQRKMGCATPTCITHQHFNLSTTRWPEAKNKCAEHRMKLRATSLIRSVCLLCSFAISYREGWRRNSIFKPKFFIHVTPAVTSRNITFCPHNTFTCCTDLRTNSPYSFNWCAFEPQSEGDLRKGGHKALCAVYMARLRRAKGEISVSIQTVCMLLMQPARSGLSRAARHTKQQIFMFPNYDTFW